MKISNSLRHDRLKICLALRQCEFESHTRYYLIRGISSEGRTGTFQFKVWVRSLHSAQKIIICSLKIWDCKSEEE